MRVKYVVMLVAVIAAFALTSAEQVCADVTVIGTYHFVNGDTATRTTYYSRKRMRATAPDGKEYIYDAGGKKITVIDHATKRYYTGSITQAESLATQMLMEQRRELKPLIDANLEKWQALSATFTDSIKIQQHPDQRMIGGYSCGRWTMEVKDHMQHERWVARALMVPNYGPELEKVVLATVMDPLGRQMLRLLNQMAEISGCVLASSTKFHTLTQDGEFSYEASSVHSNEIPKDVWSPPAGYERVKMPKVPKKSS